MNHKLSRAQVETLLILDAIGHGCPLGALASRLGLCPSLGETVDQAARKLGGLIVESEDGFKLSGGGQRVVESLRALAPDARTQCA